MKSVYAVVGEFEAPERLLRAARAIRQDGYRRVDAFTPFPVHGLEDAMGIRRSRLGFIVFAAGLTGMAAALLLQWWTGAVDYPLNIGGKPFFAFEFSVPVTFELTVLLASFAAVSGMLALSGLPRFYHPVFEYSRWEGITDDRFLLAIERGDPKFDLEGCQARLKELGAVHVEVVVE